MIKPTRRTVLLFVGGIPPSLIIVLAEPSLWTLCAGYVALIFLAMAADAARGLHPRALRATVNAPTKMFIGEKGTLTVAFAPVRNKRSSSVEILLEQRGYLEKPPLSAVEI